jgi:hypothetical protein
MKSLLFALAVVTLSGCIYKGAKVVEGSDIAVGLQLPGADGALQLQFFNYLSGFRLGVDQNARLKVKYSIAETNSILGVWNGETKKTIDATVEPCETQKTEAMK